MPLLNWKTDLPEDSVRIEESRNSGRTHLALNLTLEEGNSLLTYLESVYHDREGELRLYLPKGWVLFWKTRDDGSRALVAHPESQEWVGTIALSDLDAEKTMSALYEFYSKNSSNTLTLGKLIQLQSVSNLEISFTICDAT